MFDKENLVRIDFTKRIGDFKFEMVALYNKQRISEEKIRELIESGTYDKNVIVIDKQQFENVFLTEESINEKKTTDG